MPDGGWLDGALGVISALEVMRQLIRSDVPLPIGVRFVDWADEEGARFGRSLLGSSACAETLATDDVRTLTDADGITLADGLAACGIDLDGATPPRGGWRAPPHISSCTSSRAQCCSTAPAWHLR